MKRIKIVVGSANPVKIDSVQAAFQRLFGVFFELQVLGFPCDSGIARQPMSDNECIEGAVNRAATALRLVPDADYSVGVEAGLCRVSYGGGRSFDRTWVVILNKGGQEEGLGSSAGCLVPQHIVEQITKETSGLGRIMNKRLQRNDIAQKEGYVGVVTNGAVTREDVTQQAIMVASAIFINGKFFKGDSGAGATS